MKFQKEISFLNPLNQRTMKHIILFISALAIVFHSNAQSGETQKFSIPLSKPGQKGSLEVGLVNGSVIIAGYSGNEVLIEASPTDKHHYSDCDDCDDDRIAASGMKRISSNPIELEATEENNHIDISSNSFKRGIDLNIKVPQNFDLSISTVNQGDIEVSNVQGDFELNNVNGDIKLSNVSGSVISNTVNGDILVLFENIKNDVPMAFSTLNGDVDVTFPANIKATAKMKSDRGEIFSDFDMEIRKSEMQSKRDGRTFKVEINAWVYGDINGGGPEYLMKNMNGNIYVRKK